MGRVNSGIHQCHMCHRTITSFAAVFKHKYVCQDCYDTIFFISQLAICRNDSDFQNESSKDITYDEFNFIADLVETGMADKGEIYDRLILLRDDVDRLLDER